MSEKAKQIIKKIGKWAIIFISFYVLTFVPNFYWYNSSGLWNGRQAVCSVAKNNEEYAPIFDLREIINKDTGLRYENTSITFDTFINYSWLVGVTSKLLYSPSQEIFYLRDGIFSLPLDISNCQNFSVFEKGEALVAVKGTVSEDGGQLLLTVTELRETVPGLAQIVYSGGIWGNTILVLAILINGLVIPFQWLLLRIGFIKSKPILTPEIIKNKKAEKMLTLGIIAPFIWVAINPILGAATQIFTLISYRDGFQSQKRKMAIAGAVLCGTGLIVMLIEGIAFGRSKDTYANFYSDDRSGGPVKTMAPIEE